MVSKFWQFSNIQGRSRVGYKMEKKWMTSLVELIQTYADVQKLKGQMTKLTKKDVESFQGDNGMDALHYAIIANNTEAVSLLFHRGIFKPPHEPKSFPYLHLAARLGHKTILNMILQERPGDNVPSSFTYKSTGDRYKKDDDEFSADVRKTPLDLAGKHGHIGCVKTILDHFHGKFLQGGRFKGNEGYIEMTCQLDSPHALRLLLSQNPSDEEIKSAVGSALKNARPECLDVLLRLRPDLSDLFEGMNLFHVLYSYSLSFDKKWYERLLAVTTILIKHGHNVGASIPFRTYPLYSMLSHSSCHDFDNSAPYLIACMLLLLNAGADPNFDEFKFEEDLSDTRIKSAFGRCAFSSALHCLFQTVEQYSLQLPGNRYLKKYMSKCALTLIKHHADPDSIGKMDGERELVGNSLHSVCRTMARTGVEDKLIKLLLQNGADPNCKSPNHYPLTTLMETLFEMEEEDSCLLRVDELDSVKTIISAMSQNALQESLKICSEMEKTNESVSQSSQRQMEVFKHIKKICNERVCQVLDLKKTCKMNILIFCGRKVSRVMKLPLPTSLKLQIVEF